MQKIKTKYDKTLGCYHSFYEKVTDQKALRKAYLSKLLSEEDVVLVIETNLGSVNNPDSREYIKSAERFCKEHDFLVNVRLFEAQKKAGLAAIFSFQKREVDMYKLVCFIPSGNYDDALFDALLDEYDLQLGYGMDRSGSEILEEIEKGYCKGVKDKEYFKDFIFDSRLFQKLLLSTPVLPEEF